MVSSPGWLSLPLHHVRLNEAAAVTQHHNRENGSWLSRHHDLPLSPPRHGNLGFGLGPSPPHLPICFSSVLCRLWTSRCTLLRQEECDSEEGKADAARRTLWDMGEVNSWQENRRPPQVLAGEGEEARGHAGSCPRWRCEKTSSTTRLFGLWERDTPVDSRDDAGLVDVGEGGYRRRVLRALIYTNL
jgi:hypothetical protein